MSNTLTVLAEVVRERQAQDAKWGEQNHLNGTGGPEARTLTTIMRKRCEDAFRNRIGTWRHILLEETYEACGESDPALLRGELIQVAAVATAWVEAIDRATASVQDEAVAA